jgi:hypothetical protein
LYTPTRQSRGRRAHEWSAGKAVTFIVTFAATRNVTLAAHAAGMSRKAAYALKRRDPAFAAAWAASLARGREGNKVEEVEHTPVPPSEGNNRAHAGRSISSTDAGAFERLREAEAAPRDLFFAKLEAGRDSLLGASRSPQAPLARRSSAQ